MPREFHVRVLWSVTWGIGSHKAARSNPQNTLGYARRNRNSSVDRKWFGDQPSTTLYAHQAQLVRWLACVGRYARQTVIVEAYR
jgi:hypothetical protein